MQKIMNMSSSSDSSLSCMCNRVSIYVTHSTSLLFLILVTLKWWDDLWLNEGFASYVEIKGVAYVEPTWDMVSLITCFSTVSQQQELSCYF